MARSAPLRPYASASLVCLLLALSGCGGDETIEPPDNPEANPAANPSGIELRLDALVYGDGDTASVTLDFGDVDVPSTVLDVAIVSPDLGDVEALTLEESEDGVYVSDAVALAMVGSATEPGDGVLEVAPGGLVIALYFLDQSEPELSSLEENVVADFALFEQAADQFADIDVSADLALTDDERVPVPGGKPVGTVISRDGLPVQIATRELIVYPRNDAQLERFLDESQGTLIQSQDVFGPDGEPTGRSAHLVAIDTDEVEPTHLAQLRAFLGEEDDVLASNEDVLRIYERALHYQLEGYTVAVNPRLAYYGAPDVAPEERSNVTHTMQLTGAMGSCLPGDAANPCVENAPAAWVFNALWDQDTRRVNVGVLDIGFAPNDDFREPIGAPWTECDVDAGSSLDCGPGRAQGPPTVGNSFFGDKSWHGTGVITTIGGIVSNDFGASGLGGQVAVPMMYKYDLGSYIFEMGTGMVRATDDGASCINVSGGYPCNILTTIGPDFNICTSAGRTGICAAIGAVLGVATGAVCGVGRFFPIIGDIACAIAVGTSTFSVGACLSTLAFGDLAGPMHGGVRYARSRGVPVIASAGNRLSEDSLPDVIREYVDLGNASIDRWQVIPAAVPEAIAVGAVDDTLANVHFFGDLVDVWAPIRSAYFSPESTEDQSSMLVRDTIGGTSAAAPYVTGLVAAMQAINPALDPNAPMTPPAGRSAIVDEIVEILTSPDNTFSNDELVSLGFDDQPVERRLLVNPLAALQDAASRRASTPYQDFEALGFDSSLNFSELDAPDDAPGQATVLSYDVPATGTIAVIPGEGLFSPPPDIDWFRFDTPTELNSSRSFVTNVTIEFPVDPAGDQVFIPAGATSSLRLLSRGSQSVVYEALRPQDSSLSFRVTSNGDNVYRVTVATPELAVPSVQIVAPSPEDTACSNTPTEFEAEVAYAGFPDIEIPSSQIVWRESDIFATGPTASRLLAAGQTTINVRVFGDPSISDSITLDVENCVGSPPVAQIDSPADAGPGIDLTVDADQLDGTGAFHEITLLATASDPDIGEPLTLTWTTDRADIQPGGASSGTEVLGTTDDITVRLYSSCGVDFGTSDHRVTFRVTDSQGNSRSDFRIIRVLLLC